MVGYTHRQRSGCGLINKIINNLPVELHVPGYQYCGPGTKLVKRLARGDRGINALDAACKQHDIAYSQNHDNIAERHKADKVLAERAWNRVLAKDASVAEKAVAWAVTNTMKAKSKLGMGMRGIKMQTSPKNKKRTLKFIIQAAKKSMKSGPKAIESALAGARSAVSKGKVYVPRILPVPQKIGGLLPFLIPIFAALSATGALAGGAAGIAKAVNEAKANRHQLQESKRHNATMEAIALGKGLYLKPYKKGMGLYLKPAKN